VKKQLSQKTGGKKNQQARSYPYEGTNNKSRLRFGGVREEGAPRLILKGKATGVSERQTNQPEGQTSALLNGNEERQTGGE